jgi:hypothetical protein
VAEEVAGTHMEVDVPVIAVAIAALPVIALLLAVVTRMETLLLGDPYEEHRRAMIDAVYADEYADQYADEYADQVTVSGRR